MTPLLPPIYRTSYLDAPLGCSLHQQPTTTVRRIGLLQVSYLSLSRLQFNFRQRCTFSTLSPSKIVPKRSPSSFGLVCGILSPSSYAMWALLAPPLAAGRPADAEGRNESVVDWLQLAGQERDQHLPTIISKWTSFLINSIR